MTNDKYREHYTKYLPVYNELAYANNGKTVWIPTDEHNGWYVSSNVTDDDTEAWEKGYPKKSRPSILPDDLSADVERTAYTTISYALDKSYKTKYYRQNNGEQEWLNNDDSRLPSYGELVAWALYVDIDISEEYKERPLPKERKEIINNRLSLWIRAFSKMLGGKENVQVLDSGGGMYVFSPATVLAPVADRYDEEERELIFKEIGIRMRTITGKLNELICQQDDEDDELFSADKVQNKSRQFKTLGAIHKSLNSVVYPIDPDNINIQRKRPKDITDRDINEAKNWAQKFTDDKYRECVGDVIEYLFQGKFTKREDISLEPVEGIDWKEILDTWVDEKLTELERWEQEQEERSQISTERLRTDATQDRNVASESVRRVNNNKLKKYIKRYLGEKRTYEKNGDEMDFFPFWRGSTSKTGRSAFYDIYEGNSLFTDKADGTSRGIVYWVALEMTYDDKNYPNTHLIDDPGEKLSKKDYRTAVHELRKRGEDIPVLVNKPKGDEPLDESHLIEVGKELGLVDESDIMKIKDENGFIRPELIPKAWNELLEKLDDEGIEHNCKEKEQLTISDVKPYTDEELLEDNEIASLYSSLFDSRYFLLDEFDSKEEYVEFIDKFPDHIILFKYDGEIAGSESDCIYAGIFTTQSNKYIKPVKIQPFVTENPDFVTESGQDWFLEQKYLQDELLDKTKITILVKPGEEPHPGS